MKSFRDFITEKRTAAGYGSPSGYDDQGEPKYTKRPGPREKGRRAEVQKSPKSVTAVKGEIEAAKGFETKSGGLDTRTTDPKYTSAKRDPRVAALGGDVWKDTSPAPGRPFKSLSKRPVNIDVSTTLRTKTGGSGRDWLSSLRGPKSSKTDPWKGRYSTSYELSQKMKASRPPSNTEPFGDTGFDPHGSQKGSPQPAKPVSKGPAPVKQAEVSKKTAERLKQSNLSKKGGAIVPRYSSVNPATNTFRQFMNVVKNKTTEVQPVKVKDITNAKGLTSTKIKPQGPVDVAIKSRPKKLAAPTPYKPTKSGIQAIAAGGSKTATRVKQAVGRSQERAPMTAAKTKELIKTQGAETARSIEATASKRASSQAARRLGRRVAGGGLLSALGAAQEYKVGAARAKREGKGKLGQAFRGASRAAGAFLGGTAGSAAGGAVAGAVGAIGGGAYGYSKGAELGSKLAKNVEKSSAGKWLAKTAKKYVPGIA
jgi:hypothetical protein